MHTSSLDGLRLLNTQIIGTNNRDHTSFTDEDSRGTVDCQGRGATQSPNGARGNADRRRGSGETRRRWRSRTENFWSIYGQTQLEASLVNGLRQVGSMGGRNLNLIVHFLIPTRDAVPSGNKRTRRNRALPVARPDPSVTKCPRGTARAPPETVLTV